MSYMKNTIVKYIDGNAFTFRNYPSERLYIDSIYSRLSLIENEVRRLIMDYIIYNAIPFNTKETSSIILEKLNISKEKFKQILDSLVSKNAMVMDEDNNVNFIYPVSAFNTNHKVHLSDGRVFSAMCAVDAMGSSFTFNQNIKINSKCSECGEDIFVEIKNGQLANYSPELTHVLHVDLNKNQNWSGNC
ncbi:alkylmercury lyase family protein [Clostridium tagluense]|nr:alkylmercury lyase family protein [Clostridium tagluense]WLC66510.1 alkylmercury lyase family protein [Clostridium tagluense]